MADITKRLGRRHLRSAPTAHIRHHRRGRLVHDGPGISFWFRALSAALSEVPVNDRELAMAFHARTADFQDVTVQATVTYRISDPALASARLDFSSTRTRASGGAPRSNRSRPCSPRRPSSTRSTSWPVRRWPPRCPTESPPYATGSTAGWRPSPGCPRPAWRS